MLKATWVALRNYQDFAERTGDPDVAQRHGELKVQILARLRSERPNWNPPQEEARHPESQIDPKRSVAQMEAGRAETEILIKCLSSLADSGARRAGVMREIDAAYGDLWRALGIVLKEVGLNHHVCGHLATLGALASGRLGTLAAIIVRPWIMDFRQDVGEAVGNRASIKRRQQALALAHFEDEIATIVSLDRLACLVAAFGDLFGSASELQSLLRERNARLLASLLPPLSQIHYADHRRHAVLKDLHQVFAAFPEPARKLGWQAAGEFDG